jgi:hypothetical protein
MSSFNNLKKDDKEDYLKLKDRYFNNHVNIYDTKSAGFPIDILAIFLQNSDQKSSRLRPVFSFNFDHKGFWKMASKVK